MPKYPFDEKNAADYEEMTERIEGALRRLEADRSIPATEESLAKLAECSRGALRHRAYPLERLRAIKKQRKRGGDIGGDEPLKLKSAEETLREKIGVLEGQLNNSRTEIAVWVEACQEYKVELARTARANKLLVTENRTLRDENKSLKDKLNELDKAHSRELAKHVVIPFPRSQGRAGNAARRAGRKAKKRGPKG